MKVLVEWLLQSLSVRQLCWVCVIITMGALSYGVRTYASNSAVTALSGEIQEIRIQLLEERAFDLRVKQCKALEANQPAGVYRERLQELLRQYFARTGAKYDLPECREL